MATLSASFANKTKTPPLTKARLTAAVDKVIANGHFADDEDFVQAVFKELGIEVEA